MSDDDIRLQKLAFEVCTRINAVTPITASALVCMVLLATRGRALTARELHTGVGQLLDQIRARQLPLATSAESLTAMRAFARWSTRSATTARSRSTTSGDEPVYLVERGEHLAAAFYRNTIIHFFVGGAIAEVALIHAAEAATLPTERVEAFWAEADRLRDLLKFDFFFEQRDAVPAVARRGVPGTSRAIGRSSSVAASIPGPSSTRCSRCTRSPCCDRSSRRTSSWRGC